MVHYRWVEEVTQQLDTLKEGANGGPGGVGGCRSDDEGRDKCKAHVEKLSVYCWTCRQCICHQCALWGGKYKVIFAIFSHFMTF